MAKTIFNTTEKSNFILNMKTGEYQNFLLKILIGCMILTPLFSLPLEFFKVYSVPGMALSIIGVIAMVFVLIGFMKNVSPKSLYLPAGLFGGLAVWAVVSLINSYYYNIALMGADGRSEGVLSVIFYGCIFLLGAQLGSTDNRRKLLRALMLLGLVQCAWGFLQALPFGFPSHYQSIEPLLLFDAFLPSGLTGSPIFLAIFLVMLSVPATIGAVCAEDKKSRNFYTICAAAFILMAVKTQTLIGFAGSILACSGTGIYFLVKKIKKSALSRYALILMGFVIGMSWASISPVINGTYSRLTGEDVPVSEGFVLYDGGIMWDDSSYRLAASGYYVESASLDEHRQFEIGSFTDTYAFQWKNTLSIIKRFPLVGSGPDNLVYPQLYNHHEPASNPNTFDRCYNYYLHLAGTLGIPALLLYLVLMVLVILRGAKRCKDGSWVSAGIYGAVLVYLIMMLFGASSVTTTPFFWMLAGAAMGEKEIK